jgi:O-antigen ligase
LERISARGLRRLSADAWFPMVAVGSSVIIGWAIQQESAGTISQNKFFALMVVAPAVVVALLRPGWPLLAIIAIPPGVIGKLGFGDLRPIAALLALVLLIHYQRKRSVFVGGGSVSLILLLLTVFAFVDRIGFVSAPATQEASYTRNQIVLYLVVILSAYAFVRSGELAVGQISAAFVVSALVTLAILVGQTHGSPTRLRLNSAAAPLNPGFDYHRTHFGYLMAAAFGVSFAWYLRAERRRGTLLLLSLVLAFGVAISFARGGWLTAAAMLLALPLLTGRRTYWLLVPVVAVLFSLVGVAQQRLFGDVKGGLSQSVSNGQIGSNRLLLWEHLWHRAVHLPWGHGFGYMWTITPAFLGFSNEFQSETNQFIYAHNDFLFWTIELGVLGLAAWIVLWVAVLRRVVLELRSRDERRFVAALLALATIVGMFFATLFDNGLFLPDVATPFFAFVGVLMANARLAKRSTR